MEQTIAEKMESQITSSLEEAFDFVINEKKEYYEKNPSKIPDLKSIDTLISSMALANSAISGGSSLIPGPWGMLAVVPELTLVIRNQIGLIYDIGAAHGAHRLMNRELAASIFISGLGTSVGGLLVAHGGKYLIRRASLQVFQKIIVILGGKITQQALKSAVSKWLPGVGALAMAAWSNYMTRKIGASANKIFSAGIIESDNLLVDESESVLQLDQPRDGARSKSNDYVKIMILTNLAKIDGKVEGAEVQFISNIISSSDLTDDEKSELSIAIHNDSRSHEGILNIANSPDDAIMLLVDLTALAKSDSKFHVTEKLYIKKIGKMLNFSESDIEEVMLAD